MKYILYIFAILACAYNAFSQPTFEYTSTEMCVTNWFNGVQKSSFHVTGNNLTIIYKRLGNYGTYARIRIFRARDKAFIRTYNEVIQSTDGGSVKLTIDPKIWGDGFFYTEITVNAASKIYSFENDLISVETTKTFNCGGMDFIIHYSQDAFTNHHEGQTYIADYLSNIEDIIRDVWQKEVFDWGLCKGMTSYGGKGSMANTPKDADNKFHIVLHNISDIPPTFDPSDLALGSMEDDDRYTFLDVTLYNHMVYDSYSKVNEAYLLYTILSHEFFHGIQASFMPATSYRTIPGELEKRRWLTEGQAKFLETEYMGHISPSFTTYNLYFYVGSYAYYTKNLMDYIYDDGHLPNKPGLVPAQKAYIYPGLHTIGYEYAVFWRHLYEHYFSNGISIYDKMALLRNTLVAQNTLNNSDLDKIKTDIMDVCLNKTGGNHFETFDEALADFTEKLYFCDNAYNTSNNKAILFPGVNPLPTEIWKDPSNTNFYSNITEFKEPIERLSGTPNASFSKIFQIPSSFAHRAHKFKLQRGADINVKFESKTNAGQASFSTFHVDCYQLNGAEIIGKTNIALDANGEGNINIQGLEPSQEIVVLVTRLDSNEGTFPDYKLSLSETGNIVNKYSWPVPTVSTPKGLFFGGQHIIIGRFGDLRKNGTTDVFCKGIEIEASSANLERNIYAIEGGVAFTDAVNTSVNIGHFRYANIQNPIANGTTVNPGDKIGEIPVNSYLYFMESDVTLTSIGEVTTSKWLDPLRPGGLSPFVDNIAPVIQSIKLVDANGANVNPTLYNKYDIIVEVFDPATLKNGQGHASLKCGIHKITVRFLDVNGNEIINRNNKSTTIVYYPNYNISNSSYELPSCAVNIVYNTTAPNQFEYIVTNAPYDGVNADKYWNTRQKNGENYSTDATVPEEALFKDGRIAIEVTVEDLAGRTSTRTL